MFGFLFLYLLFNIYMQLELQLLYSGRIFNCHYHLIKWLLKYEPRQANLCLRAFRHDKFQLRMPSFSEGPGIRLSVWRFLLIHCLYERAAKILARLRGCAGSPEPSLLAYAISTKFAWRGTYETPCVKVDAHPRIPVSLRCPHEIHWVLPL